MFWGLIMEPNKRYTQTVDKSFHVSMASLDAATADDSIVQVMVCYEDRNYLLCSLKKETAWQVPLDLNFQEGTKIAFTCNGHGHVHMTGYLIPDEDLEDLDDIEEEEEEEEEEQIAEVKDKHSKRKAMDKAKNEKKSKRAKQEAEAESSDDEDLDLDGLDADDDSEDSEEGEEEEAANEEEEDDSDEEEEDEEEEEEEEEEEKPQPQKDKKKKQQQQQKQQQQEAQKKKKEDKKKMVNGTVVKQDQPQGKEQKKKKGEQNQNVQTALSEQKKRTVEGGVQVEDLKIGGGPPAKPGRFVSVYYVGRLKNGKKFDASTSGDGFKFRLGKGEVIKGWDVGIAGMKIGGKRRLTIPAAMAYGAKGSPPVIPGNTTLIFEVELRNVH